MFFVLPAPPPHVPRTAPEATTETVLFFGTGLVLSGILSGFQCARLYIDIEYMETYALGFHRTILRTSKGRNMGDNAEDGMKDNVTIVPVRPLPEVLSAPA
jgi:hypothetical protein